MRPITPPGGIRPTQLQVLSGGGGPTRPPDFCAIHRQIRTAAAEQLQGRLQRFSPTSPVSGMTAVHLKARLSDLTISRHDARLDGPSGDHVNFAVMVKTIEGVFIVPSAFIAGVEILAGVTDNITPETRQAQHLHAALQGLHGTPLKDAKAIAPSSATVVDLFTPEQQSALAAQYNMLLTDHTNKIPVMVMTHLGSFFDHLARLDVVVGQLFLDEMGRLCGARVAIPDNQRGSFYHAGTQRGVAVDVVIATSEAPPILLDWEIERSLSAKQAVTVQLLARLHRDRREALLQEHPFAIAFARGAPPSNLLKELQHVSHRLHVVDDEHVGFITVTQDVEGIYHFRQNGKPMLVGEREVSRVLLSFWKHGNAVVPQRIEWACPTSNLPREVAAFLDFLVRRVAEQDQIT